MEELLYGSASKRLTYKNPDRLRKAGKASLKARAAGASKVKRGEGQVPCLPLESGGTIVSHPAATFGPSPLD